MAVVTTRNSRIRTPACSIRTLVKSWLPRPCTPPAGRRRNSEEVVEGSKLVELPEVGMVVAERKAAKAKTPARCQLRSSTI